MQNEKFYKEKSIDGQNTSEVKNVSLKENTNWKTQYKTCLET